MWWLGGDGVGGGCLFQHHHMEEWYHWLSHREFQYSTLFCWLLFTLFSLSRIRLFFIFHSKRFKPHYSPHSEIDSSTNVKQYSLSSTRCDFSVSLASILQRSWSVLLSHRLVHWVLGCSWLGKPKKMWFPVLLQGQFLDVAGSENLRRCGFLCYYRVSSWM